MYRLEVMNPVAPVLGDVEATPPAPRPDSLEGKTIGLVWNGKANGDVALKRAGELIRRRTCGIGIEGAGFPVDCRTVRC